MPTLLAWMVSLKVGLQKDSYGKDSDWVSYKIKVEE